MLCSCFGIARAGFYAWLYKSVSDRAIEDHRLLELIRASYSASRGVYGARRVFQYMREAGELCGKHRVAKIGSLSHGYYPFVPEIFPKLYEYWR